MKDIGPRIVLRLLLVLAICGFLLTFVVEGSFLTRSIEVQPVARDARSDTGWRLAGPPTRFINLPTGAFVTHGAPGIPAQVDIDVVSTHPNVVPVERLSSTVTYARFGALLAGASAILGMVLLRRSRTAPIG